MLSSPFLTSNILFYIDFFNISYIFIVKSLLQFSLRLNPTGFTPAKI